MKKWLVGILMMGFACVSAQQARALPYDQGPTPEQEKAIQFMLNNLANRGMLALGGMRSRLKAEGDKTDGLHPLRFFLYAFENPQLRADLRKMRGRGVVWRNFMQGKPDGFDVTFNAQANLGNMKREYVDSYAESLGIDPAPLWQMVQQRNWTGLIDQTFTELNRQSQGGGQMGNGRPPEQAQPRASAQ